MTLSSHAVYPGTEGHGAPPIQARRGPEPWRIGAAVLIVVIVVAAIWLWGRPHPEPPRTLVAVTSEAWAAGQPPGEFDVTEVPEDVALRLADPDTIAGKLVTHDIPAGTFVVPALLGLPDDTAGSLTVLRFVADTSAWPVPGPRAGSHAVVATALGGCALEVATLAGGSEGAIVVRVDVVEAARLAGAASRDGLVVWPAPPDGWPECSPSGLAGPVPSPRSVPNAMSSSPSRNPAGG